MKTCPLFGAVFAVVAICGCRTPESGFSPRSGNELDAMETTNSLQSAAFARGDYATATRYLATISSERTVSSPQYELERASILLVQGRKDEAHAAMMKAREEIELLTDPESEKRAVSLWHGENSKVFKGDAHERATLYALLGLSFLDRGDYEDSLRCVKNGLLADSSNEKEAKYNSDYALLQYIGYVASAKSGDAVQASVYASEMRTVMDARKLPTAAGSPIGKLLSAENLPDALLVVWTGRPPSYYRGGAYGEIRQIVPGKVPLSMLTVSEVDEGCESVLARKLGDVNFQATTRGGRRMDEVLADKASVKCGFEASGNFLIVAGLACLSVSSDNALAETVILSVGGGCLLLGATCHGVGYCINPDADVRAWQNLPGEFVVVPVKFSGDRKDVIVRGYCIWDNVATERVTVARPQKGVGVSHLSMLPSEETGMKLWREMREVKK